MALAQEVPDDFVFDRAVVFGKPGEHAGLKAQLKESFLIASKRVRGAYLRNTFIVRNAWPADGNIAIVIGYSHVDDLFQATRLSM